MHEEAVLGVQYFPLKHNQQNSYFTNSRCSSKNSCSDSGFGTFERFVGRTILVGSLLFCCCCSSMVVVAAAAASSLRLAAAAFRLAPFFIWNVGFGELGVNRTLKADTVQFGQRWRIGDTDWICVKILWGFLDIVDLIWGRKEGRQE